MNVFYRMYRVAMKIVFMLALYCPMDHLAALNPFSSDMTGFSGYSFINGANERSARNSKFMKKKKISQRNQTGKKCHRHFPLTS